MPIKNLFVISFIIFCAQNLCAQTDSSQFYIKQGIAEKIAHRYLVASIDFGKALKFNPSSFQAYFENGVVNREMRKFDAAQGNFIKAYSLEPNNQLVAKELCTIYFNNRQFQKVIDIIDKSVEYHDGARLKGMSLYNLEDYGKAVSVLKKVIVNDPADVEVLYILAKSYLELEDYKNAIINLENAISINPSKFSWIYELAQIYQNKGDYINAIKYYKLLEIAGYNKSNDFLENMGFAYINTGDVYNGLKTLQIVLSRKPGNKELLSDIAQALFKAKKYDDALVYYQKLLVIDAKDANALYMAGISFLRKGEKQRGQQMCDQAIIIDPSLSKNRQKSADVFGL